MKRKIRGLIVKLVYLIQAIKRINRFHLMDTVVHADEYYILTQGVAKPFWNMSGKIRLTDIHESRFKLKNPILGRLRRIGHYYKFKVSNWYMIDTWNKNLFEPISKLS